MDKKHIVIATDNVFFKNHFRDFFDQDHYEVSYFDLNVEANLTDDILVDSKSTANIQNAIKQAFLKRGTVDAFVNYSNFIHLDYFSNNYEALMEYWDYKVLGCLRLIREIAENMKSNNNGSIVNIINLQSRFPKLDDAIALSADMAILNLTKGVAADLIDYSIKCNSISLGDFEFNKFNENEKELIPAKRLGQPIELMNVIKFILSDENQYLVGENINLDGGYSRQL
ncbi:MAG: hypothetical protein CL872_00340 [Dehalococcoidaceae bacterium]|nr:hypothetical protein [Dehalococcoidaceae bacterium]